MATYYADYVNGSDANNGLGPDASAATNKPWKTMAKVLGAAGIASGDTVYLSPAGPFREVVTVAMTSATADTQILGDPGNVQGFKTSGGVTVTPGPVVWTAYTTDDKTAPSASSLLTLAGRDFFTFKNIMFVSGSAATILGSTTTSTNINWTNCAFLIGHTGGVGPMSATTVFGTAFNWVIDRCWFTAWSTSISAITFSCPTGVGADYDIGVTIKNSCFFGQCLSWVNALGSGASANKPGGVIVRNCSFFGRGQPLATNTTLWSTTIPCVFNNNLVVTGNTGVNAGTSGQITEDYNLFATSVPRTNVTAGTHSISDGSYAPMFFFGQELAWGMNQRPFGAPMGGSPILGFGNDGSQSTYDIRNGPKPAGGQSANPAVGCFERANSWGRETTTVRTGSNALSVTGPGYQEFDVPVDASSTTVSVYMRYDATYAGTKPTISVLNGAEAGVTDATSSAVTTVNTWEQLSLTFTPTSKGIVTVRLNSTDTNGGGKAFADDRNF